jgi:predicted enzyme related to lactoylglutathione lyase
VNVRIDPLKHTRARHDWPLRFLLVDRSSTLNGGIIIMANTGKGRFVWRELMSTNVKASTKFYTELFGWKASEMDIGPMGKYTLFNAGDTGVGGMMQAPEGVPSHWTPYVGVDSVDDTLEKAKAVGAKILVPGTDVPGGKGRFGLFSDPFGAVIGPFQGGPGQAPPEKTGPGIFCWDEVHTKDCAAAAKFYESVFGWTHKTDKAGEHEYWEWKAGDKSVGGMIQIHGGEYPPMWLSYVEVASVDPSNQRATGLGAKPIVEPRDIPKVGRFSVLADPTGATFALFKPSPEMAGHKA